VNGDGEQKEPARIWCQIHHIVSAATPASDNVGNTIPLCFDCHAEVSWYNPTHPKGRKFTPGELRQHKEQWLELCRVHPEMFVTSQPQAEAGSLERLANEMTFNLRIANYSKGALQQVGALFEVAQFRRAIADGTFTWISDDLRKRIEEAYAAMLQANSLVERARGTDRGDGLPKFFKPAQASTERAHPLIVEALDYLELSIGSDYP